MKYTGYIGTYDAANSKGIYRFSFDDETGRITCPTSFFQANDCKCITRIGDDLAITGKFNGNGGICLLADNGSVLDRITVENASPCFITTQNNLIYTANYHDGNIMIYKVNDHQLNIIKKLAIANEAGCHQVILAHERIFVPCLNLDCVNVYLPKNNFALVDKISFNERTGPRHGIFTSNGKNFYLVSELSNELFYFSWQANKCVLQKQLSILKSQTKNSSTAAIRLSPDERFLYISTRGSDLLSVFSLHMHIPSLIQQIPCAGSHPRDFLLSSNGNYLLVVNRFSNELVSLHIDKDTGLIGQVVDKAPVCEGVGIVLK